MLYSLITLFDKGRTPCLCFFFSQYAAVCSQFKSVKLLTTVFSRTLFILALTRNYKYLPKFRHITVDGEN